MIASRRQISWSVWTLWVAGGALGGMVGAIFWYCRGPADTMPSVGFLLLEAILTLGILVFAAMPAFLQWLIVRHSFPQATWWTLTLVWLSRHAGMNQPSARDPAAYRLTRRGGCRVDGRQEVQWPQEDGIERDGRALVR